MVNYFTCLSGKISFVSMHYFKSMQISSLCDIFDRFCPYTTATSTATLSSAHQISENSDQPQQRPASCGGGCGCLEPIHGKFGRGCCWKLRFRLKIAVVDGALNSNPLFTRQVCVVESGSSV